MKREIKDLIMKHTFSMNSFIEDSGINHFLPLVNELEDFIISKIKDETKIEISGSPKDRKRFIQYGHKIYNGGFASNFKKVDQSFIGYIQYFDGEQIVSHDSKRLDKIADAYKWIVKELKEIEKNE